MIWTYIRPNAVFFGGISVLIKEAEVPDPIYRGIVISVRFSTEYAKVVYLLYGFHCGYLYRYQAGIMQ